MSEKITWENLSAELVLSYLLRVMELEGAVITYSELKRRYAELKPEYEKRVFGVACDMLEDQGFLEDKIGKIAGGEHDGGFGHIFYVYEPAEGWADHIVAKVCELRGLPVPTRPEPVKAPTKTGCGRLLAATAKTCGYDDYRCSICLKDKK